MPDTDENLHTAFAGESQANRKYLAFAKKAEQEGYPNVGRMFKAISEAETIHAMNHFQAMGAIKGTADNLETAMGGEHYEVNEMYPPMLEAAQEEEQKAAIRSFGAALATEKVHEGMYQNALTCVTEGSDIEPVTYWVCPICGQTFEGDDIPDKCPVCNAPKAKFMKFE
ncbi:MAG TPA: rubrerythrin family protein [Candidatus Lokiarchaeia archaeon]|nr:rubrerythrin family protein [Candidatus Lokiarchaeia archaeon]